MCTVMHSYTFFTLYAYCPAMCIAFAGHYINSRAREDRAVALLPHLEDVTSIEPLIDLLMRPPQMRCSADTTVQARAALARLLPRLNTDHAGLITEKQRAWLRKVVATDGYVAFGMREHSDLAVSALIGLHHIGDWHSLRTVEVAARKGGSAEMRATAEACLPYLRSLTQQQNVAETLLRASCPNPSEIGDRLLRPAGSGEDAEPQQLLRPSDTERNTGA